LSSLAGCQPRALQLDGFETYLSNVISSEKDRQYLLSLSRTHHQILANGNASSLHSLSKDVRRNAMRALSHLAKFNGLYETWQKIVKQNGLRWKQADDNFDFFEKENIEEMLGYVRRVIQTYPGECGNAFIFATLTGLRPDEACQAIRLVKQGTRGYYNAQLKVLEHFRYKDIFLRRSKKAFISLVDEEILEIAKHSCDSYQAINSTLKRDKMEMRMSYCRKIFGTWLRKNGIETELIDMLQGRIPSTVFGKHYYRPSFEQEQDRVSEKIRALHKEIK